MKNSTQDKDQRVEQVQTQPEPSIALHTFALTTYLSLDMSSAHRFLLPLLSAYLPLNAVANTISHACHLNLGINTSRQKLDWCKGGADAHVMTRVTCAL